MPIGAAMAGQTGVHQPQVVEQLRPRAERAADSRHAGPLVERQRGRDVQHLIHIRPGRLRHPAARVGGQGLQIPPGALGIQNPQRQGGFSGAGDPGDAHDLIEWNLYVNVFQIVDSGAPNLDLVRPALLPRSFPHLYASIPRKPWSVSP